jgi:hypothetical protein
MTFFLLTIVSSSTQFEQEWEAQGKTLVGNRSKESKGDGSKSGTDSHGIYDGSRYNCVYSMVDHLDRRRPADLFHKALMALFLAKSLQLTDFFGESTEKLKGPAFEQNHDVI